MRRSGLQLSKAAPRALGLASSLSWWNIKGQHGLIAPVQAPTSPHLVRIRSREGPVELVRNGVEVIGEQSGIDIEGHRRGGVPRICCTAFTLAPAAMARLAVMCRSSCGLSPGSPAFLAAGSKKRGRKFVLRSTTRRPREQRTGDRPAPFRRRAWPIRRPGRGGSGAILTEQVRERSFVDLSCPGSLYPRVRRSSRPARTCGSVSAFTRRPSA
jgi:hypothetical protein